MAENAKATATEVEVAHGCAAMQSKYTNVESDTSTHTIDESKNLDLTANEAAAVKRLELSVADVECLRANGVTDPAKWTRREVKRLRALSDVPKPTSVIPAMVDAAPGDPFSVDGDGSAEASLTAEAFLAKYGSQEYSAKAVGHFFRGLTPDAAGSEMSRVGSDFAMRGRWSYGCFANRIDRTYNEYLAAYCSELPAMVDDSGNGKPRRTKVGRLNRMSMSAYQKAYASYAAARAEVEDHRLVVINGDVCQWSESGAYRRLSLREERAMARQFKGDANRKYAEGFVEALKSIIPEVKDVRTTHDEYEVPAGNCVIDARTMLARDYDPLVDTYVGKFSNVVPELDREHPVMKLDAKGHEVAWYPVIIPDVPKIEQDGDEEPWRPDTWLASLFDDPISGRASILQVLVACLRPLTDWQRAFLFYNTKGRNGKGTVLQAIRSMVGDADDQRELIANMSPQSFSSPFEVIDLLNRILVLRDEVAVNSFVEESDTLKAAITHESVKGRHLYSDFVEFTPTATMVFCLNSVQASGDKTTSFFSRFHVVTFDKCFLGKENRAIKSDYVRRPEVSTWLALTALKEYGAIARVDDALFSDANEAYRAEADPVRGACDRLDAAMTGIAYPADVVYAMYKCDSRVENPSGRVVSRSEFLKRAADAMADLGWKFVADRRRTAAWWVPELAEPGILPLVERRAYGSSKFGSERVDYQPADLGRWLPGDCGDERTHGRVPDRCRGWFVREEVDADDRTPRKIFEAMVGDALTGEGLTRDAAVEAAVRAYVDDPDDDPDGDGPEGGPAPDEDLESYATEYVPRATLAQAMGAPVAYATDPDDPEPPEDVASTERRDEPRVTRPLTFDEWVASGRPVAMHLNRKDPTSLTFMSRCRKKGPGVPGETPAQSREAEETAMDGMHWTAAVALVSSNVKKTAGDGSSGGDDAVDESRRE